MAKSDFVPLPAAADEIGFLDLPHTSLHHGNFEQGLPGAQQGRIFPINLFPGGEQGPPGGEQTFGQHVREFVHDYLFGPHAEENGMGQGLGQTLSQEIHENHLAGYFLPPLPPFPPSGVAPGDFTGTTIHYHYAFASLPVGGYSDQDLTIGPGVELAGFPAPGVVPSVGYMDITGNSLTIDFTQNASFGGQFDSFTLSDIYNQVPDITGVTLVKNGGSAALTQDDVKLVNPNEVTVDLLGTSFAAGSEVVLNFSFASSTDAGLAPSHDGNFGWLLHS